MTSKELEKELSLGYTDYDFLYKGQRGAICPFNKESGFYAEIVYDGQTFEFDSLEDLMHTPFLNGKTLAEAAEELEFYG